MCFQCLRRLQGIAVTEEMAQTLSTCQPITRWLDPRAQKKALFLSFKPMRTCRDSRHRTRIYSQLKAKWALRSHLFPSFLARSPKDRFYSGRNKWSLQSHSRRAFSKRSLRPSNPDSRLPTQKTCPDKELKSKMMAITRIQTQTHTTRRTPRKLWTRMQRNKSRIPRRTILRDKGLLSPSLARNSPKPFRKSPSTHLPLET